MFRPWAIPPSEIGDARTDHAPVGGQPAPVRRLARPMENPLIRLAIDLIANADQLHGSTEGELRRSLGLGD